MSAFIVDRAHIDVLVQGLAESETVTDLNPDELGRVLWRENLTSLRYRYPRDGDGQRPGPIDFRDADVDTYVYRRPTRKIEHVALLVAIGCYEYQSCEHPEWQDSTPYRWIATLVDQLRRAGTRKPRSGEHMEAWSYDEETVHGTQAAAVAS